jgi:glutamate-1-semialdehyde 2,1-aminomutase
MADVSPLKLRAESVMPAGVNSPVRAFRSVGGEPIFAASGSGPRLRTTDGRDLIDFCMSFGPLILGHAHPEVVAAVAGAAARGTSFAVTTEAEIEMAELIRAALPSMEKVRLMSSGTEAAMTALRLARGATGRNTILKFTGCYHGHSDSLLVEAGSGVAGMAQASSAGVPDDLAGHTVVAPYNDIAATEEVVRAHAGDLACITVEPVAGNMGVVLPEPGFLERLRELASETGALLLFDEVITGFRITFGGYQNLCGIVPDLTCLGKIIGGGLPIGAVGGRADLMDHLAPLGSVYQAGTLSGNPISVAAGLAALRHLKEHKPYPELEQDTQWFVRQLGELFESRNVPVHIPHIGSMFSLFFSEQPVHSFADVMTTEKERFVKLFHGLLESGVYLAPSPFEAGFLSTAHDRATLGAALSIFRESA